MKRRDIMHICLTGFCIASAILTSVSYGLGFYDLSIIFFSCAMISAMVIILIGSWFLISGRYI